MWDNASLLRGIANALIALSVLAVLYGVINYAVHLPGLFPLHNVRLSATPQRVDATDVLQVIRTEVQGNFFTVNIERLRKSMEKLPWVRSVSIRREFPYRLIVQLEEHQALARWNNHALVNQQGEVFVARSEQVLPNFSGPDGTATEMTQHYTNFNQQLAALNLQAGQITLSPRRAWELRLSNGMVLELGREDLQQRLARFVAAYPSSLKTEDRGQSTEGRVAYVDLRYRNGFAVRRITNVKG
jgi:cell division protein FtsQ